MATLLDDITEMDETAEGRDAATPASGWQADDLFAQSDARHPNQSGADAGVGSGNATPIQPDLPDLNAPMDDQFAPNSQLPNMDATTGSGPSATRFTDHTADPGPSTATWGGGQPAPQRESDAGAIRIKGRTDGVSIEIGEGDWRALMAQLDARLEQAAGFFSGGQVILNVGGRSLNEAQLYQVREVLTRYSLNPGMVRTGSNATFEAALTVGMAVTLEAGEDGERITAQQAESNVDFHTHYVYRGNLRSGQLLQRSESILVIGDVNPGAQLVSDGDILVWGRLRGVAHAGASGAEDSVIGALQFEPTQLRIGALIAISPDQKGAASGRGARGEETPPARIAYVVDDRIIVSDWIDARRSGKSVLRR